MKVRLISYTKPVIHDNGDDYSAEYLMAYCARVSSPNQENPSYEKLLRYCIEKKHWSIFEMADMTVEIITSRSIAQQILRHRSFCFQEFSQRYAKTEKTEEYKARRQDMKNRQNSIEDIDHADQEWFREAQSQVCSLSFDLYNQALEKGIARECARILLPLGAQTKLYMKGSVRSWIHYIELRTDSSTQKEHRDIAIEVKSIFVNTFPTIAKSLLWSEEERHA